MAIFKDSYPHEGTHGRIAGYDKKNIFVNRFCTPENQIVENRWIDLPKFAALCGRKCSEAMYIPLFFVQ
jgi:hypothetical protein